ncbi:hypothetical protein BJ170DRAFT_611428 [Xylariales sp. AK1849]|nr:hypothetical protein BJ170DRAFT_611428 [Xylariales sp. AK1849]
MHKGVSFNAAQDIPSLAGKVILITGGSAGVGKQTALDLAKHNPSQLWIAARSAQKSNAVIDEIKAVSPKLSARFLELDLSSFDSIKSAARSFLKSAPRLDILIANAGLMGGPASFSEQGHEMTIAVNHVGHALLIKLLTPLLLKTTSEKGSDVRVVILSSRGHAFGRRDIIFDSLKNAHSDVSIIDRYCQAKLANLVYARGMAEHYPQFITVAINPGDVKTGLYGNGSLGLKMNIISTILLPFIAISVEDGAKNSLWAATAKGVESGEYYEPVGISGKADKRSQRKELTTKLWDWTEKELQGQDLTVAKV